MIFLALALLGIVLGGLLDGGIGVLIAEGIELAILACWTALDNLLG